MVKFCLQCNSAFWGGQYCPICPGEIELLDAALPENKKYLAELNIDVRPKYYARSSMLLSCFGFVMALPLGAFVFLRGLASSGNVELWAGIGIGTIVFLFPGDAGISLTGSSTNKWKVSKWKTKNPSSINFPPHH